MEKITVTNFWLRRKREPDLIRIVQWAQWKKIPVNALTEANIREALQSRVPNPDDDDRVV